MRKPRCLDLFCGAGGATCGLQRAGFHVTGVDIAPQPRYCGDALHQADAMTFPLEGYDFIWASPPCHHYTTVCNIAKAHGKVYPDLVMATRERLVRTGSPWVIENVPRAPLIDPIVLCGQMFGLRLLRHRAFESTIPIQTPAHVAHKRGMAVRREIFSVVGCAGSRTNNHRGNRSYQVARADEARLAMGIRWMIHREITQAVPPAYSEFIGRQVLESLR